MIGKKFCFDLFPADSVPDSLVHEFICLFNLTKTAAWVSKTEPWTAFMSPFVVENQKKTH